MLMNINDMICSYDTDKALYTITLPRHSYTVVGGELKTQFKYLEHVADYINFCRILNQRELEMRELVEKFWKRMENEGEKIQ